MQNLIDRARFRMKLPCLLIQLALGLMVGPTTAACGPVAFDATGTVFIGTVPTLSWSASPEATGYAVDIVSRVPEGGVITRQSIRTQGLAVGLPRLDASRPTKIILEVAPVCRSGAGAKATYVALVVPGAACASVTGVSSEGRGAQRSVVWSGPAAEYEVSAFDSATGALIDKRNTRDRRVSGIGPAQPVVIAVRKLCDQSVGPPAYLFAD